MNFLRNIISGSVGGMVGVVLAGWGLATPCLGVTPATFATPSAFPGGPVGWTYAGNKFVGTVLGDGTGKMYQTDLTGTTVTPFGGTVNLLNGHGFEHYVSASAGLGGFPLGDIYVASDNNIQHITNAGVPDPGLFVNGSTGGITGLVRGIMFDTVGTFGNKMIVTTDQGFVYTIDSAGNPTQIASTGEDTEGLDIAPLNSTWTGKQGWLFVGSEGSGTINAIKPGVFTMVPVAVVPAAEQVDFVPMVLGNNPLEGLYSANFAVDVLKTNASQFTGMEGDLVVTGETNSNIFDVTPGGSVSTIGVFPNQPEDGLFISGGLIDLMTPEPASLAVLGIGGAVMMVRRRRA